MAKRRRGVLGDASRAVGYVRVSTDEQQHGPKAQAAALDRWAAQEGVQLVAVYFERGVSGAAPLEERKALLGAITAVSATGAGVLVAAKRDRLARDVGLARTIEAEASKAGATIRTADGTSDATGSAGIISRGLHDLLGEWEREVIRERTRAALAVKKAKGERIGSVPFGYRMAADGVQLEPDPAEQATLARIRSMREIGISVRAIAAALNADSVPARGKRWHPTSIARLAA